jgi:hypothetical protein
VAAGSLDGSGFTVLGLFPDLGDVIASPDGPARTHIRWPSPEWRERGLRARDEDVAEMVAARAENSEQDENERLAALTAKWGLPAEEVAKRLVEVGRISPEGAVDPAVPEPTTPPPFKALVVHNGPGPCDIYPLIYPLGEPVPRRLGESLMMPTAHDTRIASLEHAVIESALALHAARTADADTIHAASRTHYRHTVALAEALEETQP